MESYKDLKQGQIIKISLNPTEGHEQGGYRPALVVSNNDFNQLCGGMVKIMPITSNEKYFPLHVKLPKLDNIHGVVELEHERSLDLSFRSFKLVDEVPKDFLADLLKKNSVTY
ncbi:type II toxin-antitoxin system PemK/MazF family toxin [Limosilactobacillus reuteri]|uniref:type II toxin-antitoxin system PemK/MazF family toxin n=1 Tax=Limosilactobacillus reuteri TaxID=1598 RepID=UPI001E5154E1|nr:type II toxin-antitoxin system PemK/MazF family toxin [Limosilactobacillus reuteri]MDY4730669.1 type II toxin-antitoxin system PemK/MazF family toxin [Lactobacillus amylovorus]MCC4359022.1 type II toxin-antitoxin system PemK/MazF family toxin [Limosilactobacillus reuteri]MCC4362515.1 type II toxin-antitoxin system PemK/MazF family toxin [Limosilactobacillus reuteri]MCC4365329.1 type II toxin-antitoxin system PemK/MazF family toxin [Limosilactobacillus reuteri]MCI6367463.1 type II toxin-anti